MIKLSCRSVLNLNLINVEYKIRTMGHRRSVTCEKQAKIRNMLLCCHLAEKKSEALLG